MKITLLKLIQKWATIKIEIGKNIINDRKNMKLKAFEIIKESSQVGATQISFLLGADRLIENYKNFDLQNQ